MIIYVDNKPVAMPSDISFEFISENRLFMGRDGYTFGISFPLKDCPQNTAIFGNLHRVDMSKQSIHFECSIVDRRMSLNGTLTVVKISDTDVECQFSEGRCSQTVTNPFEDTIISNMDLGAPDILYPGAISPSDAWKPDREAVALPWINESYPSAPNNWVAYEDGSYSWHPDVTALSWQPYLIEIARRICKEIDYDYDFSEWEKSDFKYLIVCNTLPASWRQEEYAKALPAWSVSEFFEKLELLLMCEFDFDHKAQTVKMRFSKDVIADIEPVALPDIVDEYAVDVSDDDGGNCSYIAAKRLAYKECSHQLWNYYSCDWYFSGEPKVKNYDTLDDLISKNKRKQSYGRVFWGEPFDGVNSRFTTLYTLMYASDVDTYFCFRSIGVEKISENDAGAKYSQVYVLQPVNTFGSGIPESDEITTEEIEFVPVCVTDTYVSADDDMGFVMQLNISSDNSVGDDEELELPEKSQMYQKGPAAAIEEGKKENASSYYDVIYIGFWDGNIPEPGRTPYPVIDRVMPTQDWKPGLHDFSLRLSDTSQSLKSQLPQVNSKQKFKFSWIASEIPNPRAVFFIRGKRYLCEKIMATFTENGMSQLLKGEFYPLVDDE